MSEVESLDEACKKSWSNLSEEQKKKFIDTIWDEPKLPEANKKAGD
jgi:hypothetical protein